MLVVLDTNTLASGAVAPSGGAIASIIDRWRDGRLEVATSLHILDELERTLGHPYFAGRLSLDDIAMYLRFVRSTAIVAPLTIAINGVATHPEDDIVLATAISARAEYLIIGDAQLRKLGTFGGTLILRPREFMSILDELGD
jgi:putative PIN family toxin of toxin-antitoxin system